MSAGQQPSSSTPFLLLALFGAGVATWIYFSGLNRQALFPLLECSEHAVGEVNPRSVDWEVFTTGQLPLVDSQVGGAVRRTFKRGGETVEQIFYQPATIRRATVAGGSVYTVGFEYRGESVALRSATDRGEARLYPAARPQETWATLRCFQLEP